MGTCTARRTAPSEGPAGTPNPIAARKRRAAATPARHAPHTTMTARARTSRSVPVAPPCDLASAHRGQQTATARCAGCRARRSAQMSVLRSASSAAAATLPAPGAQRSSCPGSLPSGCADRTPTGPPRGTQRSAPAPTAGRSANRSRRQTATTGRARRGKPTRLSASQQKARHTIGRISKRSRKLHPESRS
jgi:hypothetical protein